MPTSSLFQIILQVEFNVTSLEYIHPIDNHFRFQLRFNFLSLNDPCVDNDNSLELCSNHGQCERTQDGGKTCRCEGVHIGDHCELVDYCKMKSLNVDVISNEFYCSEMRWKCLNDEKLKMFKCDCGEGTVWDIYSLRLVFECKSPFKNSFPF